MNRRSFLTALAAVPMAAFVPACPAAPIAIGEDFGGIKEIKFDPILTSIALQYVNQQRYISDTIFPVIKEA